MNNFAFRKASLSFLGPPNWSVSRRNCAQRFRYSRRSWYLHVWSRIVNSSLLSNKCSVNFSSIGPRHYDCCYKLVSFIDWKRSQSSGKWIFLIEYVVKQRFKKKINLQNNKERVHEELREVLGDSKRSITMADLSELKYLECCIKEALRLYPSVPLMGRTLSEDTDLRKG